MQKHCSKYFACRHTLDPDGVVKGSKDFFSESSHVAHQIIGDQAKSTMQVHILSLHTPRALGLSQKVKTFFSESRHCISN